MPPTSLVIAPHGMDDILGCGGTICRLVNSGHVVESLVLFGDGTGADAGRRRAASSAAQKLGSRAPNYAGFPENRSDTLPLIDVVKVIEHAIDRLRPSDIYVPHGGNLNIDHQIGFRAAITAARPVPNSSICKIMAYEILSSTDWAAAGADYFRPTLFVDISMWLKAKLDALSVHGADIRPPPHARSLENVRALAHLRGHGVGIAAAEAFVVVRDIRRLEDAK